MISFDLGGGQFNYRVAGICLEAGRVLLQQAVGYDFWTLPGGRGELLEDSRSTLVREMHEELGVEVTCGRLLWVLENFFTYEGRAFHELALFYSMTLPVDSLLLGVTGEYAGLEPDNPLVFRWFPVDHLTGVKLYPTVLRTALRDLPATTQHLMHHDEPDAMPYSNSTDRRGPTD